MFCSWLFLDYIKMSSTRPYRTMHPTCSGEFYYDSGFYDPQFSCLIFVPVASSSVYIDEDFSILGALSLDVFVISFKATVPGPIAVMSGGSFPCVTWPPWREINMATPIGAISPFIDKMQFGSLLFLFFLIYSILLFYFRGRLFRFRTEVTSMK